MSKVTLDYSKTAGFISEEEIGYMSRLTEEAKNRLVSKSGAGNDFVGWVDLPVDYDKEEFERIKKAAQKIQSDSEVLVVIGIGGSYLGARAAIEFLRHGFYNNIPKEIRKTPEIYYAGNSISGAYTEGLLDVIGDRDFSVFQPNRTCRRTFLFRRNTARIMIIWCRRSRIITLIGVLPSDKKDTQWNNFLPAGRTPSVRIA